MPASEAQILANKANATRSTGPRTERGREISRANSYKHGLTATVVMPQEDAAEVERLSVALGTELKAEGEVGKLLVHRMATMAVRMDRCAEQETAAIAERVRRAIDEFEAPEGVDADTADRLRQRAGRIALFDPSKPACLARKYEAAAERCFFRSLKELRQLQRDSKVASPAAEAATQAEKSLEKLGSFLPAAPKPSTTPARPTPAPSKPAQGPRPIPSVPLDSFFSPISASPSTSSFVPISVGRPR